MRKQARRRMEEVLERLEGEGFYAHASPSFGVAQDALLAESGDPLPPESGPIFYLDAEALFESGPAEFLGDIGPFFAAVGAAIVPCPTPGKEPVEICLDGRVFVIVPWQPEPDLTNWVKAGLRLLVALDWYLERRGVRERCYYTHLDNDSVVGFLTERMAELLIELGDAAGRKVTLRRPAI